MSSLWRSSGKVCYIFLLFLFASIFLFYSLLFSVKYKLGSCGEGGGGRGGEGGGREVVADIRAIHFVVVLISKGRDEVDVGCSWGCLHELLQPTVKGLVRGEEEGREERGEGRGEGRGDGRGRWEKRSAKKVERRRRGCDGTTARQLHGRHGQSSLLARG